MGREREKGEVVEEFGSYKGPDCSGFGGHQKDFAFYSRSNKKMGECFYIEECSEDLICVFRSLLWLP